MPILRAGFTTMACLPASLALFTSELLAERVVPVPFDGSTMVEGTDCPTIVSSADDAVRGNFVAGLEKLKTNQNLLIDNKKYSILQLEYFFLTSFTNDSDLLSHRLDLLVLLVDACCS